MDKFKRHAFLYKLLKTVFGFAFIKILRFEFELVKGLSGPYIVLANHTMNYDPILLGLAFKAHMYFVASEHIFRTGLASRLLLWIFAPITRTKGATDAKTVIEIMRQIKKGRNIALFPEGSRTYDGLTCPIHPATAKMVKASGAMLVTYKFEGGYFTNPRWGNGIRKGRVRGYIVNTYSSKQLEQMSAQEVQQIIACELAEDAYARQNHDPVRYAGKNRAVGLETSLYICPCCKKIGTLKGMENMLTCSCGLKAEYTEYGYLHGKHIPYTTITEWNKWQEDTLKNLAYNVINPLILSDMYQELYCVEAGIRGSLLYEGIITMDSAALTCGDYRFTIEQISNMAIVGRMTLVFTTTDGLHYEIKSKAMRSAVKYYLYFQILKQAR